MSYIIRNRQGLQLVKNYRRFLSSPSISITDDIITQDISTPTTARTTTAKQAKVKHLLSQITSESYLNSIASTAFVSYQQDQIQPNKNQSQVIKRELYKLVDNHSYSTLMDVLLQWSNSSSSAITDVLSSEEISYLIKKVIEHQISLMHQFSINTPVEKAKQNLKLNEKLENHTENTNFIHSRQLVVKIRDFYSNLIYANSNESIYSEDKKLDLYDSKNLSGFKLSVKDYENLIHMELHNFKLDLASKWFQRFEDQFGVNYLDHMTYNLWTLKFQIYSGGLQSHWIIQETDLSSTTYHNPRHGPISFEVPFEVIYKEFIMYNIKRKSSKIIMKNDFIATLIYSMGYSNNVEVLSNYIESKWGITSEGILKPGFQKLGVDHPNHPDINILKSIMISLSYNGKFFEALKYINSFQDIYEVNISGLKAKSFWQDVFKWCDISTRYEGKKALQYFLKNSQDQDLKKKYNAKAAPSLSEVQRNTNFDYTGYLNFMKNLQAERSKSFAVLWDLYQQNNGVFSRYIYKRYLDLISEDLEPEKTEQNYYKLLTSMLQEYEKYGISKWSFNKRDVHLNQVNDIDQAIYALYSHAMKSFISYKCRGLYGAQCLPLINKWSIDDSMREELGAWFKDDKYPKYKEYLEKKREEFMVTLRGESEGEDDRFLDLI